MTLTDALRIGWERKGWVLGPAALTAGIAALAGVALESRARYTAGRVLEVTRGATAEAVLACRSRGVLAEAAETADVPHSPEDLVESVRVEAAGARRLHLLVERSSREEAERLADALARAAVSSARVHEARARADAREEIEGLEERLRQLRASREAARRELADLVSAHPEDLDAAGLPLDTQARRLIGTRDALISARRELAAVAAEVEAIRTKAAGEVEAGPGADGPADPRLAAMEKELARLREELTDAHPRVASLLRERARLLAEGPPGPAGLADERPRLEEALAARRADLARLEARIGALKEEERRASDLAKAAADLHERARAVVSRIEEHSREMTLAAKRIESAKTSARAETESRPALRIAGELGTAVRRSGYAPGPLAAWGAVLGLMLGGLLAALAEAVDPAIRTGEDARRLLDVPVLATIPASTLKAAREEGPRWAGAALWAAAFILAAAIIVVFVYPGWRRLRDSLSARPAGRAVHGDETANRIYRQDARDAKNDLREANVRKTKHKTRHKAGRLASSGSWSLGGPATLPWRCVDLMLCLADANSPLRSRSSEPSRRPSTASLRLPPPLRGRVRVGGADRRSPPLPLTPSPKGRGDRSSCGKAPSWGASRGVNQRPETRSCIITSGHVPVEGHAPRQASARTRSTADAKTPWRAWRLPAGRQVLAVNAVGGRDGSLRRFRP
jgi:uncharacterized protein involved in exopolysaccharide biosynthesis